LVSDARRVGESGPWPSVQLQPALRALIFFVEPRSRRRRALLCGQRVDRRMQRNRGGARRDMCPARRFAMLPPVVQLHGRPQGNPSSCWKAHCQSRGPGILINGPRPYLCISSGLTSPDAQWPGRSCISGSADRAASSEVVCPSGHRVVVDEWQGIRRCVLSLHTMFPKNTAARTRA